MEDTIQNRIKKAYELLGLTQKEFAEQAGIPQRTLQNYSGGQSENISHVFLVAICSAHNIDSNWLLFGVGVRPKRQI